MTTVRVEAIHPKCLAAMLAPPEEVGCGCMQWKEKESWWLCEYHLPFNDGCWAVADSEPDSTTGLIEQLMQIAHSNALFHGGFGDRDPVVGFGLIMGEWNRICAENDNYETEIERLRSELATANHRVAGLTETLAKERKSHEPLKGNE